MPNYPGLGLPLRNNLEWCEMDSSYPIGANSSCYGSAFPPLPVREVCTMSIMETLTDKEDWHKKVFDKKIVAKWREEANAIPNEHFWDRVVADRWGHGRAIEKRPANIFNDESFEYCIRELQDKAVYFEKTRIVPTLDAFATVAKSDSLMSPGLHQALLDAFSRLLTDHKKSPDWHPNTNHMVQDLVHPSMFPLVYGRSRVFNEEVVGVLDAVTKWAGSGDTIAKEIEVPKCRWCIPPKFWSNRYQWLPSNVAIKEDGSVHFTSYINNLHPTRYPDMYRTIEKLVETCLPMWDQCLVNISDHDIGAAPGRTGSRISIGNKSDENPDHWTPYPSPGINRSKGSPSYSKWLDLRQPVLLAVDPYKPVDYTPKQGQRLADRFRDSGLQIIVKMASIELNPEKPLFPVGRWHIEGQMNERICGTALYYLDSENVTSSNLSFRMQTDIGLSEEDEWKVGQDQFRWLEINFGTHSDAGGRGNCLQNYGRVETREGRLLCFSNNLQHRVSPFRLVNPNQPGHRRFITLWLVDPTQRIISTANVPPQQRSWWAESVLRDKTKAQTLSKRPSDLLVSLQDQARSADGTPTDKTLPQELVEMVQEVIDADSDALPTSMEEAIEHRAALMNERSTFVADVEFGWETATYNFCEH